MNNISQKQIRDELKTVFSYAEAKIMVEELLRKVLDVTVSSLSMGDELSVSDVQKADIESAVRRLLVGEPLQYVIGKAFFYKHEFYVDARVLIPRPETEELVDWIVRDGYDKPSILDIGTGSGCIAISLCLAISGTRVRAMDVSEGALAVACGNARTLNAEVEFVHDDIFTAQSSQQQYDVIVSNPPYIMPEEKFMMEANVLDYEPYLALFTPVDEPLKFYIAIAKYAHNALKRSGALYFEINRAYSQEITDMLDSLGFVHLEQRNDMQGNPRMIKAVKL